MSENITPADKLLQEVIGSSLCTGCGTCIAVCPVSCFSRNTLEPVYTSGCIECGACYDSCPGKYLPMSKLEEFTFGRTRTEKEHGLGVHIQQYIGYASDENLRNRGTAGGVVTALLSYLLESKIITGAVCTGFYPDQPWRPAPVICRTVEEVQKATKSKYSFTPQVSALQDAKNDDKLAFVGLPCQVEGVRKAAMAGFGFENVKVIIGLLCANNFRLDGTIFAIEKVMGLSLNDVKEIGYRHGEYPGSFMVITKDGREVWLTGASRRQHMATMATYRSYRCMTCCDWAAELSDISVGDVFTFDPEHVHVSNVLARNQMGMGIIKEAIAQKYITLEEVTKIPMEENQGYRNKYHANRVFIREAREHGLPTPTYPEIP